MEICILEFHKTPIDDSMFIIEEQPVPHDPEDRLLWHLERLVSRERKLEKKKNIISQGLDEKS